MKPLWVHTLVWLAAVLAALLMAMAAPEGTDDFHFPQGAAAPR